jgi:hypothetical protein
MLPAFSRGTEFPTVLLYLFSPHIHSHRWALLYCLWQLLLFSGVEYRSSPEPLPSPLRWTFFRNSSSPLQSAGPRDTRRQDRFWLHGGEYTSSVNSILQTKYRLQGLAARLQVGAEDLGDNDEKPLSFVAKGWGGGGGGWGGGGGGGRGQRKNDKLYTNVFGGSGYSC